MKTLSLFLLTMCTGFVLANAAESPLYAIPLKDIEGKATTAYMEDFLGRTATDLFS